MEWHPEGRAGQPCPACSLCLVPQGSLGGASEHQEMLSYNIVTATYTMGESSDVSRKEGALESQPGIPKCCSMVFSKFYREMKH